jgi:hypothetical protein
MPKEKNNPINRWANEWNRQFSKELQIANNYMKKGSTSLVIKEMQIKMIFRFCLTLVRIVIIKKTMLTRMLGEKKPS